MIEFENTDVNIVRNLIPMRNHMPASAYGLKAISDWFTLLAGHNFPKSFLGMFYSTMLNMIRHITQQTPCHYMKTRIINSYATLMLHKDSGKQT